VNIVRNIEEILEFPIDVDNVLEWINLYASIYYGASAVNDADDMIFEERYSVFIEWVVRETVAEKFEELKGRKKRSRIFFFFSFFWGLILSLIGFDCD
jgi:hypothetical protein